MLVSAALIVMVLVSSGFSSAVPFCVQSPEIALLVLFVPAVMVSDLPLTVTFDAFSTAVIAPVSLPKELVSVVVVSSWPIVTDAPRLASTAASDVDFKKMESA